MSNINEVEDAEILDDPVIEPEITTHVPPTDTSLNRLLSNRRHPDESQEDFKVRRKSAQRAVKGYLKSGTLFHNSVVEGKGKTYHREKK